MKLSDAILQGCQGTEQHFGEYFLRAWAEDIPYWDYSKCCALGAALIATDTHRHGATLGMNYLIQIFPELDQDIICPVTGALEYLQHVIASLNDIYRWTREQIANWLQERGL